MEIRKSKPQLSQLFSLVLALGNYLNGGTPRGQVYNKIEGNKDVYVV